MKEKARAATILHFTGTGNTRRAAEIIAERLQAAGWDVVVHELRKDTALPQQPEDGRLLVLSFPVLGLGMPAFVRTQLRGLRGRPAGANAASNCAERPPAAVFATWGGAPSAALWQAERFLRGKGFAVIAAGGAAYPFNWTQFVQPPDASGTAEMLAEGDAGAAAFAELLLQARRAAPMTAASPRAATPVLLLELAVYFLFSTIGRYGLAGLFTADERCTACGICTKGCPVGVLALRGKGSARRPSWRMGCQSCNRCINSCPRNAIQGSAFRAIVHGSVNAVLLIALIIGLNSLSAALALPAWLSVPVWIAVFVLGCVYLTRLQLAALEPLVFRLESIPFLRRLAGRSWTAGFRRYTAPPRRGR
jgi:ferredoxin